MYKHPRDTKREIMLKGVMDIGGASYRKKIQEQEKKFKEVDFELENHRE